MTDQIQESSCLKYPIFPTIAGGSHSKIERNKFDEVLEDKLYIG